MVFKNLNKQIGLKNSVMMEHLKNSKGRLITSNRFYQDTLNEEDWHIYKWRKNILQCSKLYLKMLIWYFFYHYSIEML